MAKDQLILNRDTYRNLQTAVNRRLPNGLKIQIPTIREYCIDHNSEIEEYGKAWLIERLVEEVTMNVNQDVEAENSLSILPDSQLSYVGELRSENEKQEEINTLAIAKPKDESGLSIPETTIQSGIEVNVAKAVDLNVSTQSVVEKIIDYQIDETVESAKTLREQLKAVRQFKEQVIGDVVKEHVSETTSYHSFIDQTLNKGQSDLALRKEETNNNFLEQLRSRRREVTQ